MSDRNYTYAFTGEDVAAVEHVLKRDLARLEAIAEIMPRVWDVLARFEGKAITKRIATAVEKELGPTYGVSYTPSSHAFLPANLEIYTLVPYQGDASRMVHGGPIDIRNYPISLGLRDSDGGTGGGFSIKRTRESNPCYTAENLTNQIEERRQALIELPAAIAERERIREAKRKFEDGPAWWAISHVANGGGGLTMPTEPPTRFTKVPEPDDANTWDGNTTKSGVYMLAQTDQGTMWGIPDPDGELWDLTGNPLAIAVAEAAGWEWVTDSYVQTNVYREV